MSLPFKIILWIIGITVLVGFLWLGMNYIWCVLLAVSGILLLYAKTPLCGVPMIFGFILYDITYILSLMAGFICAVILHALILEEEAVS